MEEKARGDDFEEKIIIVHVKLFHDKLYYIMRILN